MSDPKDKKLDLDGEFIGSPVQSSLAAFGYDRFARGD